MSLQTYNPTGIVHETSVDIGNTRALPVTIKLTQGDKTLPVIAVHLLNNGQRYQMPQSVQSATLNVLKADRHAVSLNAEGTNNNRDTLYFVVTEQTCAAAGKATANVQIQESASSVAGTGTFYIRIDPDPTYEADFNDSAASDLEQLVQKAQAAAENAEESATEAQSSAKEASESAELAGQHKDDAESAKKSAEQFANTAEQEATNAENARDKAEEYMEKAQASSAVSNSSYYIGNDGMLHLKFDSDGLGQNDIDQTLSELKSDVSGLQSDIEQDREVLKSNTTQISQAGTRIDALETASTDYVLHVDEIRSVSLQISGNPTWTPVLQNALTYEFKTGGYYLLVLNGVRVKCDNPSGNLAFAYSVDGSIEEQIFSIGESVDIKEIEMPIIALVNIPQGTHTVNIHVRNEQMQALTFINAWTVGQLILFKI